MKQSWIVVADGARARLFRAEAGQQIREFEDMLNPDARLQEQELVFDSPMRGPRGAGDAETHHAQVEKVFAERIADRLIAARRKGEVERLHLVAAPRFLGLLRAGLDEATQAIVASESRKNLVRMEAQALRKLLPEHL